MACKETDLRKDVDGDLTTNGEIELLLGESLIQSLHHFLSHQILRVEGRKSVTLRLRRKQQGENEW